MKYKALLFDLDGTLLDTSEYIYQAFEYSLNLHFDGETTRDAIQAQVGLSLEECYRNLTFTDDLLPFISSHQEFQAENAHLSTPFPHVLSTLEKLHSTGLQLGIITNRARDSVEATLNKTQIDLYINQIITIDDVEVPKPDPEGIYKLLTYFEVEKSDALFVGDTDVDIFTGKNAGVKTIGVTYGFGGESIYQSEPDHVVNSIGDIIDVIKS